MIGWSIGSDLKERSVEDPDFLIRFCPLVFYFLFFYFIISSFVFLDLSLCSCCSCSKQT